MRLYFFMFCSLVLISAIVSIKNMAILIGMLTLGLGLPLLFAPSALVYLLCLLPAFGFWPSRGSRFIGVAVSLALVALVAVFPGILSRNEAQAIAEIAAMSDRRVAEPVNARSMEILRPAVFDPNHGVFPFSSDPCPAECRYLLISGQMDWIRVNMTVTHWNGTGRNKTEQQLSTFVAASGRDCDPERRETPSDQRCVLVGPNSESDAAMLAVISQSVFKPGSGTLLTTQRAMRRITLTMPRGREQKVVHQSTESVIATTFMPFLIGPRFVGGMESAGFEIMRGSGRLNKISLRGALEDAGYDFANIDHVVEQPRSYKDNRPPSDTLTLEVVSILDLPGTQPFNRQQMDSINRWVTQARGFGSQRNPVPLTAIAKAIMSRLITDPRVQYVGFIDQVLGRQPGFLGDLMPTILGELEKDGRPSDVLRSVARTVADLDAAALAPYAARIDAVRRTKFPIGNNPLLRAVGKLGSNPVPILALTPQDEHYAPKLDALCHAEKTWSGEILGATLAYMQTLDPHDRVLRQKLDRVEPVMMRHGGWEQLGAIYSARFPDRLKRMDARERRLRQYPDRCL